MVVIYGVLIYGFVGGLSEVGLSTIAT